MVNGHHTPTHERAHTRPPTNLFLKVDADEEKDGSSDNPNDRAEVVKAPGISSYVFVSSNHTAVFFVYDCIACAIIDIKVHLL